MDTNHSLLSLSGFTDSEGNVLDFIVDEVVDFAETVVRAVMADRLKAALPLLSDSEQTLIQAIFFEELVRRHCHHVAMPSCGRLLFYLHF